MKNFTLSLLCLLIGSYAYALNDFGRSLPPTGTISYNSPFCSGSPIVQPVITVDLTPGGTYSASPVGLAINASTGEISPSGSIAGIYVVTYFIPASGPDPDFQTTTIVQILAQPDAGVSGGTTVCEASTAAIDLFSLITGEQSGGSWTRTSGTGGTFNAAVGVYTPAIGATTSTFTYTLPGSAPCVNDSSFATITINAQPSAGSDGSVTVCESSTAAINLFALITGEQAGGTWTRTTGFGGTFNAAAGIYTPAVGATSSTFSYTTLGVSPCISDTSTATINLNAQPSAGINGNLTICDSDTTMIDLLTVISGEQSGGVWTRISGTGGTFNAAAGTFIPQSGTTTSQFAYDVPGISPCVPDSSIATVTIGSQLILDSFPDLSSCSSYTLPQLSIGNYYTAPGGAGTLIQQGSSILVTTMVYIYAESGTCTAEESFMVTIFPFAVPVFSPIPELCAGSVAPLLPTMSANGITGTWSPSTIDTSLFGTMTYVFTPDALNCAMQTTLSITVTPCGGITLNAFLDSNSNGLEDIGEQKFPLGQFNYVKNDDGIVNTAIAPNGLYIIYDSNTANTYDLTYSIPAPDDLYYSVSTPSYTNISPTISMTTYNFPITVLQSNANLEINLVPVNTPRPGFTYDNTIYYTNSGNTVISSGSITFTKDPIISVQSVSEALIVNTTNGFTFEFSNLGPFETRSISVTMLVPAPPTVNAGQLLTNTATISNTDMTLTDTTTLTQQVVNSYDPNDKTESHGKDIVFSSFSSDEYLYYTIRFENTGNANAVDVRISDLLDEALDQTSVRGVASSYDYVLNRIGNSLEFTFKNIQLPPSVPDTNIGHGYVTFKVKPNPGFTVGDIIPNTASIYFDFNPAIVTNTFNTQFVPQLATNEFDTTEFELYPNPASDKVTLTASANSKISSIAIYDILGKRVIEHNSTSGNSQTIDVQSLGSGIYFMEVSTSNHLKTVRKLIVR